MNTRARRLLALSLATTFVGASAVHARKVFRNPGPSIAQFQIIDAPLTGTAAHTRQFSALRGGPIAAIDNDALIIDGDSGQLLRVTDTDLVASRLVIGPGASQLVVDPLRRRAYVADRDGDRIAIIDLANAANQSKMRLVASIKTAAEPYGLALSPDGKTIYVTTVADAALSAFATDSHKREWTTELAPEPRGVAVSPNGKQAIVSFLSTGAAARIDLTAATPSARYTALDSAIGGVGGLATTNQRQTAFTGMMTKGGEFVQHQLLGGRPQAIPQFARGAFATTFIGDDIALVAHQLSVPSRGSDRVESRGTYGGGGARDLPIENRLALLSTGSHRRGGDSRKAGIGVDIRQVRAVAYDGERDLLHLSGFADDLLMTIADVAAGTPRMLGVANLRSGSASCGPTGIDVRPDGGLRVYCSFSRSVARVTPTTAPAVAAKVAAGKSLAESRLSAAEQRGRDIFRGGRSTALSANGVLACSSCHPEGRADGLSWRIEGQTLQTPLLGGRLVGTHPFKWDGGDADLSTSLRQTVRRLGGTGLSLAQANDLAAYLLTIERPRPPSIRDEAAVARGDALFRDDTVGCAGCHEGAMLTDQTGHNLAKDLKIVDTPSLIGLAASAPYYHDGSAPTLRALLFENGSIHDMGKVSELSTGQVDDLVAFLETL